METSDHNATASPTPEASSRRSRSGRVVRAPSKFSPEAAPAAGKRKRPDGHDGDDEDENHDAENEAPASDSELSDVEIDDGDEHDGDAGAQSKKKNGTNSSRGAKKPAAKKPKINGTAPTHASSLPSRPKKGGRVAIATHEGEWGSLYADVFGSGDSSDDVAGRWYRAYTQNNPAAVTNLVNCVLQAAGCEQHVTEDDINDPDNCENRIAELQSLYEDQQITDYPLIARSKESRSFRHLLNDFFGSLINVMHETQALYDDEALMENIARWVATMSSSTLRPFRHTATTVALAMHTALVQVTKKLDDRITRTTQQLGTERGRRRDRATGEKLASIQEALDEANRHRDVCATQMKDLFETVFVHRYRDVDSRIRTECVEAIGTWIYVLPTVYMEPEFLRYLGWMLSDLQPPTRAEVLRQLAKIFRREAEKLGHFIDRFRPRLVEMATRDSDTSVRVAAIAVTESLRDSGMLEPDDIDKIGKLIFDAEVKVRKAVVDFFNSCVDDVVESKVEEIGGEEVVNEIFDEDPEPYEFDSPRKEWIIVKSLAETLTSYEQLEEEEPIPSPTLGVEIAVEVIDPTATDSRIALASQVLFEKVPEISNWEILAGYLLFDHTVSHTRSRSRQKQSEATFRAVVAPTSEEEATLLEVLASAVKLSLAQGTDHDRHKKRPARPDGEGPEGTAVQLAGIIPQLLSKYGAQAGTATIVLRLHHYLDLEVFQQLRQDSTTYARLLGEICTQFIRHADSSVIAEATLALLEARRHDELQEMVDRKLGDLWQNCISALRHFDTIDGGLSVRGNLDENALLQLITVVLKISKLASISAVDVLEAEGPEESRSPAIEILVNMVHRGKLGVVNEEIDNIEDEVASYAIKACHFYFMWKTISVVKTMEAGVDISREQMEQLSHLHSIYETNLIYTFSSRGGYDDLRLFAAGCLCDLQLMCAQLGNAIDRAGALSASEPGQAAAAAPNKYAGLKVMVRETEPGLLNELIAIYDTAERLYAKRAKKTLAGPDDDDAPFEEDMLSDDENEADQGRTDEGRKAAELRAEKNLCDIAARFVLVVRAGMIDKSGPRAGKLKRRLLRNQARLGPNFKHVLAFLDESKKPEQQHHPAAKKKSAKAKGKEPASGSGSGAGGGAGDAASVAAGKKPAQVIEEIVVADDSDDDNGDDGDIFEEVEPEEGTVEDLRRRELLDEEPQAEEEEDDDGPAAAGNDGIDEDDDILGD